MLTSFKINCNSVEKGQLSPGQLGYHFGNAGAQVSRLFEIYKGLLIMKLVVRIFALSVVIAGAAAASVSSSTTHMVRSHQSATETMPVPACGPYVPTCPPPGQSGQ
jgi:hypothetical protein